MSSFRPRFPRLPFLLSLATEAVPPEDHATARTDPLAEGPTVHQGLCVTALPSLSPGPCVRVQPSGLSLSSPSRLEGTFSRPCWETTLPLPCSMA